MDSKRYALVSEQFQRAIELDPVEREAFLGQLDESLRADVERLLSHDESSASGDSPLASPVVERLLRASTPAAPKSIGPYEVEAVLGEGGMGTVFRCRQAHPIERLVAVKLIKLGMDSTAILDRFERERRALERMDHPHIARVLDAGLTEEGRPYFAMEYVDGESILEYCDRRKLNVPTRLSIFVAIARAIHHAHQKGILHRDIKPGNVLVSEVDGEHNVKVIDFGLARAVEPEESGLLSVTGQVLGTPAYMSPEQADPTRCDLDSRTDVYSLGVLLYELLTGNLPFESKGPRLPQAVDSTEPMRPSSRFSTPSEHASRVAAVRSTSVRHLRRELNGDLDWIVVMALETEVARRYPSASEFAADVERFLANEPVHAGPPSTSYRLRKFYQRNRVLAWSGSLFVLLLLVSLGVTTHLLQRARAAEANALELLSDERARNDIFQHMLVTADPREVGKDARVSDLLQRGVDYTLENHSDKPRVASVVLQSLGTTLRELGYLAAARDCLTHVVAMQRARVDVTPRDLSFAINSLAILHKRLGEYEEAEHCYREAIELSGAIEDAADVDLRSIAASNYNLGRILIARGKVEEAEGPMLRAIELQREHSPDDDEVLTYGNAGMAELYSALGRDEVALDYALESVEHARRAFDGSHPHLATSLMYLAATHSRLGQHEEADPHYRESVEVARRAFPEFSASLKTFIDRQITHFIHTKRFEEADELLAESAEIARLHHAPESMEPAYTRMLLGHLLLERGEPAAALAELKEAESVLQRTNPGEAELLKTVNELVDRAREAASSES